MADEKVFSVYLFLSYKNLQYKIAEYVHQLGYVACDGFASKLVAAPGVAIIDDQLSADTMHQIMRVLPIIACQSSSTMTFPCETILPSITLNEFAEHLYKYVLSTIPKKVPSYFWAAQNKQSIEILERIELAARKNCTVLIQGESGTGKEVVAQTIHRQTDSKGLFIPLNCGAIPLDLVESELFGHEKGSFTGAISQRIGKCEVAANGTLFLDEIGDMPLSTQVKLLRVLQEHSFERLGASKPITLSARIISATNQPLLDLIAQKQFREDLFYRLNILPIELLPLRTYAQELPDLIKYLMVKEELSFRLSPEALALLQEYPWPGNIRQLINMLKRLDVFYDSRQIYHSDIMKLLKFEPNFNSIQSPILPYSR